MNEADLKAAFVELLREQLPNHVTFRLEDRFSHGIPDIVVTGNGRTFWLEGKYANPNFDSKGIQELKMRLLAQAGMARYIVWEEKDNQRKTYIVQPRMIRNPSSSWTMFTTGFDHQWLVNYVRSSL